MNVQLISKLLVYDTKMPENSQVMIKNVLRIIDGDYLNPK